MADDQWDGSEVVDFQKVYFVWKFGFQPDNKGKPCSKEQPKCNL